MLSKESTRAPPAGIRRDPQDDRLVGAIGTPPSIPNETAATSAASRNSWRLEARRSRADWRTELTFRSAEIAKALLGHPNLQLSKKGQLRFGRKGSLVVATAGPKAGNWFDHENRLGGDLLNLIRRQNGGSFVEAVEYAQRFIGHVPAERHSFHASGRCCMGATGSAASASYQRRALELWNEGLPIVETIAVQYLAMRGIAEPAAIQGEVLRFHPSCPYGEKARHPCMLALLRDIRTDEPRAIHRTALTSAGDKIGRMTLGPKTGAAIKLSADEDVTMGLAVGEGVETVLSAMQMGFTPAWALGDAGNVRAFPVLSGIECLTIIVDNDEGGTGQRAALECSMRWTGAGREVFRVIPDRRGDDMNNVVQRTDA
jgi:putative DNA primase/helicase